MIVDREQWERSGIVADEHKTLLLLDERMAERYIFKTHLAATSQQQDALKKKAEIPLRKKSADTPATLIDRSDILFVYAYFKNQAEDEANADNTAYQGDVRFNTGKGTRLMRPLEKNNDVHAVFPVRINVDNNQIVFPNRESVRAALEKCVTQYAVRTDKTKWRL
jgi:hypothetical protein